MVADVIPATSPTWHPRGTAWPTDWWAQVPHFDQLTEVNADWAGFFHRHVGPRSHN